MRKRFRILMAGALALCLLSGCKSDQNTAAQETATTETEVSVRDLPEGKQLEPADDFAGGTGTEADPYQIADASQLALMAQKVSEDDAAAQASYILTADISLNEVAAFDEWKENAPEYFWEPIGRVGNDFSGIFDGDGYTVSGMYINTDTSLTENYYECYYGLFGELTGTVKNLNIENSYIWVSGISANMGSVAGNITSEDAKIENCSANVVIDCGSDTCGGIVGNAFSGTIEDCVFTGTINSADGASFTNAGGIIGSGSTVSVSNCVNQGTVAVSDVAGGIIGWFQSGTVSDCSNEGIVSGDRAGGVIGNLYLGDAVSEEEYAIVENCVNNGEVSGTAQGGGISATVSNDSGSCAVNISGCENNGVVSCDEIVAGIIGEITSDRNGSITVEACKNYSDINGAGKTGGIICDLTGGPSNMKGELVVRDCENSGNITSDDMYSAGVITYWMLMSEVDFKAVIENCVNTGDITSQNYAGGILCFTNNTMITTISDTTSILINGCRNEGTITGLNSNSFVGGIVANIGMEDVSTQITNCVNTGVVKLDYTLTDESIKEMQGSAETFTLTQIVGGIVGRVGDGLLLTTDSDQKKDSNVNCKDATIIIENCASSGKLSAPDYSDIVDDEGEVIFVNCFGGIIGQCSAEDGYSFLVENCSYANTERGLGNTEYSDVGKAVSESKIMN